MVSGTNQIASVCCLEETAVPQYSQHKSNLKKIKSKL